MLTETSRANGSAPVTAAAGGPAEYARRLAAVLQEHDWSAVDTLADAMRSVWLKGGQVFICGNGGSAANAVHWANDFVFPVSKTGRPGLRITALTANTAVVTCLANDIDYENVFAKQLEVFGQTGDLLIALSGSGNSPNIVRVLEQARGMGITTAGILGFSGGKCLELSDLPVHFPVDDMQFAEDLQVIVGHMVMQVLRDTAAESWAS